MVAGGVRTNALLHAPQILGAQVLEEPSAACESTPQSAFFHVPGIVDIVVSL